jgi:KipI family sensor histidine kinase inhibitor
MGLYPKTLFYSMGDRGLLVEFGDEISREINEKVRRMALVVQDDIREGIVEVVPTYRSLLIIYNSLLLPVQDLKKRLKRIDEGLQQAPLPEPKLTRIPAVYGGHYGPDLEEVARYHQISPERVIQLHCSKPYLIYMIGFMPGYPYMGELPEELVTPRLKTPRLVVPKGSVAIAQRQTGIYSMESPGGWQILGRTPVELSTPGEILRPFSKWETLSNSIKSVRKNLKNGIPSKILNSNAKAMPRFKNAKSSNL